MRYEARGDELVVLVDEEDREVGTALKAEVHGATTPLHRAFSVFLFDEDSRVLVTRRALSKKTWPGVWSNSCCGHPAPGESYEQAVERRVREELQVACYKLEKVADYRYRFEREGVVENEVCPVFRAKIAGRIDPDPEEVGEWQWITWDEWVKILENDTEDNWSPWCKEEVRLFKSPA